MANDTIGSGGTWTTIALWVANLGGAATDTGELLDQAFDETFDIAAGTNPTLKPTAGAEHDSTEGSGARVVWSTGRASFAWQMSDITVEHIEIDFGGYDAAGAFAINCYGVMQRILLHGISRTYAGYSPVVYLFGASGYLHDCFAYDIEKTSGLDKLQAIRLNQASNVHNTTIHDVVNAVVNAGVHSEGITANAGTVKNCLVTDVSAVSGTANCYLNPSVTSATNASSDSTAPSPIGAEPVVAAVEYVSTADPPDLRLAAGAESIGAGTDLGTTPTGVNFDIVNYDRDAGGVVWDVGANQRVAAGGGSLILQRRRTMRALLVR